MDVGPKLRLATSELFALPEPVRGFAASFCPAVAGNASRSRVPAITSLFFSVVVQPVTS